MGIIVAACVSQFHDSEGVFELLLAYNDGREIGHAMTRSAARQIADEVSNAIGDSALARQAEALQRENAGSWNPIATCPVREPVDLWCVYGGEEFAQYDGGASIGKFVPNRHKSEEYGFFGNQSNNGVPHGHAPDLIPVAWRKAAPQCPSELIAEVLGIPRTLDEARTLLKEEANADN